MWALIKFQARVWSKSPSSLFAFFMPVLFLTIMAPMAAEDLTTVLGNVITINMISTGLMGFGFTMFEYRKSIIMKRIGSTSISKPMALLGFFSWHFFQGILSVLWTFFVGWLLSAGVSGYYKSYIDGAAISWGGLFYGVTIGLILSLVIGFFFVSISKNIEMFNMFTMLYFFFATFIGGLFFPTTSTEGAYQWMTYVGYLVPHTYIAQFLQASFGGSQIQVMDATGTQVLSTGIDNSGLYLTQINESMYVVNAGYTVTDVAVKINPWDVTSNDGFSIYKETVTSGVITDMSKDIPKWKANLNIAIPLAAIAAAFYGSLRTFKWDVH